MPRSVFNWTFNDIVRFLKDNGFRLSQTEGSHFFYTGAHKGVVRQVCIPFHGSKTIKPRTFKGVIAQSGIPKEEWFGKN